MGCCITLVPPQHDYKKYAEVSLKKKRILFIQKYLQNGEIDYIPCILSDPYEMEYRPNFLIFFHGNEQDIFSTYGFANAMELFLHMNIITVEYPGYSIYSTNSQENMDDIILNDSLIIYDKIKEIFVLSEENIFILGRGFGSAPATYLASKRNPGGLFLVSAFTSMKDFMNKDNFSIKSLFVKSSFDNKKYIKEVTCPILLVHGLKDTYIPPEYSIQLFREIKCKIKECIFNNEMTYDKYDSYKDIMTPIDLFIEKYKLIKTNNVHKFNLDNIMEFKIPNKFNNYIK